MKVQFVIGADLSKKAIDFVCHNTGQYLQISNDHAGFKSFLKWTNLQGVTLKETLVVMEHTGLYSLLFEEFLHKHVVPFKKVNALQIIRSAGIVRGKSDKLDAARIASFGYEKREKLPMEKPTPSSLKRLKMLYSTRERIVKLRSSLLNAIKEYRHVKVKEKDIILKSQMDVIKSMDKQVSKIEEEVAALIKQDASLQSNFTILQSITGVGKVVALATIIKTENFTRFTNWRKFACFCGTAPFEHSSGSSIRKRTRVSHLADKQMKTLLDLAAKNAIQYDKELKNYYQRRVQLGKPKMSTINIVRNKILSRMFAVIKRQTPFTADFLSVA